MTWPIDFRGPSTAHSANSGNEIGVIPFAPADRAQYLAALSVRHVGRRKSDRLPFLRDR